MPERKTHFENILKAAREAASQVKDPELTAEVLVAIAIASNDPEDLKALNGSIAKIKPGVLRSEAVAVIAKRMAKSGKIVMARELVFSISPSDNYWRAEVCARIGFYSRDPLDFGNARRFAEKINDSERKSEAMFEINIYENNPELVRQEDLKIEHQELVGLVAALARIGEFKKAQDLASGITVAHWRARALASVARILAEAL